MNDEARRALEMAARAERRFRDEMWAGLREDPGPAWHRYAETFARVRAVELHLRLIEADLARLTASDPWTVELRRGFRRCRDDLRGLYEAGRFTLQGMELELDWAREHAGVDPVARAELRAGMEYACTLADEGARFVAGYVGGLEARMRALDEEAEARREALREIDEALD